jgi:hypothetical protein
MKNKSFPYKLLKNQFNPKTLKKLKLLYEVQDMIYIIL